MTSVMLKKRDQKRKIESEESNEVLLTSTQLLLLKKEKKLCDILLSETANSANLITFKPSNSEIISSLAELSRKPVKIIDKKTAENRIRQW